MKLLRMQATFGRLDGDVLELHDGLNVITAPNEAGKSTWCAFLLAMLYGIDTAQRDSRDVIADKNRYQPWSGKPMAGRLELIWQGRPITIERQTKGRVPLGEFRAYDTQSGAPIPELTAQSCGQLLTGATRAVFERSAFVRQADHAVRFDAALEQQLQELVSTGDDAANFQQTIQTMQQLKNRCRHHKTGLIPEVQAQLEARTDTLAQMEQLQTQLQNLQAELARQETLDTRQQADIQQRNQTSLQRARLQLAQSRIDWEQAAEKIQNAPSEQVLDQWQTRLRQLLEAQTEPVEPPVAPPALENLTAPEAARKAREDSESAQTLEALRPPMLWPRLLPLLLLPVAVLLRQHTVALLLCGGLGICLTALMLGLGLWQRKQHRKKQTLLEQLLAGYQAQDAEGVMTRARDYLQQLRAWQDRRERGDLQLQSRQQTLLQEISAQLPVEQLSEAAEAIQQVRLDYMKWKNAAQRLQAAQEHYDQLAAAIEAVPVESTGARAQQLARELAICQGKLETLGDREQLLVQKQELEQRLAALQRHYDALDIAMTALQQASDTLQARFAPPLRQLTGQYLQTLTDGRYDTVQIDRKLQLALRDPADPAAHPSGYYSAGTRDQLYLALRLAIARLLLAEDCPCILDDALVCFDDRRLERALQLLSQLAQKRQILLFSCQSREAQWQKNSKKHPVG